MYIFYGRNFLENLSQRWLHNAMQNVQGLSLFNSVFVVYTLTLLGVIGTYSSASHSGAHSEAPTMVFAKPLDIEDANTIYFEILEPSTLRYIYKARPARNFGTSFNQSMTSVELSIGEPLNGCSKVTNQQQIRGNGALFVRGDCSFLSKALVAQEAGAQFVIISDNDPGSINTRIDMVHDETGRLVNIPTLFIAGKDGSVIRNELNKLQHGRFALLNIPINLTHVPYHKRKHPPWTLI